jgi:hypothetical protein
MPYQGIDYFRSEEHDKFDLQSPGILEEKQKVSLDWLGF